MQPKRMRAVVGLAVLALAVTACGSGSSSAGGAGGRDQPLVIGFMDEMSGPYAALGIDNLAGAKIAVSQANSRGGVLGRKVQLKVLDNDSFSSQQTVANLHELASDGINLILGPADTTECLAVNPLLAKLNALTMTLTCADPSLTGSNLVPNFFRTYINSASLAIATAKAMCKLFAGVNTWDTLGFNYVTATDQEQILGKTFSKCGINRGANVKVPLTATQMLPYIQSSISHRSAAAKKDSILFLDVFGDPLTSVIKEGASLGLFTGYKAVFIDATLFDDTAKAVGKSLPKVYSATDYYYAAFHTPQNSQFVNDFRKANNGQTPNTTQFEGYRAARTLFAGIEKARSTDTAAVRKALEGLTIPDPQGTLTINPETHQGDADTVIREYMGTDVKVVGVQPYSG